MAYSTFAELWGPRLDRELGSADQTQLFTQERRMAAINEGAGEFCRLTDALMLELRMGLVTGQPVYAAPQLTIAPDRAQLTRWLDPFVIEQTITGQRQVLEPPFFTRRSTAEMNRYQPGWRTVPNGTPQHYIIQRGLAGFPLNPPLVPPIGDTVIILNPPPAIRAGDTWTLVTRAGVLPQPLIDPADIPFTVIAEIDGETRTSPPPPELAYYGQALVHWAAYQLEKLRRNYNISNGQLQLFQSYVQEYLNQQYDQTGEDHVSYHHDYLGGASRHAGGAIRGVRTDRWFPE